MMINTIEYRASMTGVDVDQVYRTLRDAQLNHSFLEIITWTTPTDPERPGYFTYVFDLGEIETDFHIVPEQDEMGAWQWVERSLIPGMVNLVEAKRIQDLLSGWHADGSLYTDQWPGGLPL